MYGVDYFKICMGPFDLTEYKLHNLLKTLTQIITHHTQISKWSIIVSTQSDFSKIRQFVKFNPRQN